MTRRRATPSQRAHAKGWLAQEGAADGSAEQYAAAAERVYDKLRAQLVALLGAAGVEALFARSAKLAHDELGGAAHLGDLDSATSLATALRALDPAAAAETAVTLFATFLALISSFIGERLTLQSLRRAWPTIEQPPSLNETHAATESQK